MKSYMNTRQGPLLEPRLPALPLKPQPKLREHTSLETYFFDPKSLTQVSGKDSS